MARLSAILFNRTINQFLDCDNLDSGKGKALTEKIRKSAKDYLDKILETITYATDPHGEVLKTICRENVAGFSEEFFLDNLSHDKTVFRSSVSDILSHSKKVNPDKLFQRLHEPGASAPEIIDILSMQKKFLKPEVIINNALKLDTAYAIQLLKLVESSEVPIDLPKLRFRAEKIKNPIFKGKLLRFFGTVHQAEIAPLITQFLPDPDKTVTLEALKALGKLTVSFDVSVLLPFIPAMSEFEQELALEIVSKQANSILISHLAPYLTVKSEALAYAIAVIIANNADKKSFEIFLLKLEKDDSWTREHSITFLQKLGNKNLFSVARELNSHENEFVRSSAQKIAGYQLDARDLEKIGKFALDDDWQVRQRAIQTLGKSGNRASVKILKKVAAQWPDTSVAVLEAIKQLGFSKGLEIAFKCLDSSEVAIQRAALEAISAITTEKHAPNAREYIVWQLPRFDWEVKQIAIQIIKEITSEFGLSELDIEDFGDRRSGAGDKAPPKATKPAQNLANLDILQLGSVWMERYHIIEEIGRGAMGLVMLVEDNMVDEMLILKFMQPELTIDKASRERFKREVKYTRKVGHPNVIRVHDLLLKENLCALSMEYFKSRGLEKILGEVKAFNTRDGLEILYQICDGMAAAHDQAVIHRDLKPSNVLVDETGHVKIVDFGIASATTGSESTLTQTGSIIGSPAYLAPERAEGLEADHRSDIYSLGILAYYMFAGKLPYSGRPMNVLSQHREGKAALVNEVNTEASSQVAQLIHKMMAVDPADRPQTMVAVRDQVKSLLDSL